LNPDFEILPEAIFYQQTNLICELTEDSFSYVFENDIEKKFYGISVFYFDKGELDIPAQLKNIFKDQKLLIKNYKKIIVSFCGKECTLLPFELYKQGNEAEYLNTFFGDANSGTILTDHVEKINLFALYRIPDAVYKVIIEQFPLAVIKHQYSFLINEYVDTNGLFKIIFYKEVFVAVLIKSGQLQFINLFSYQADHDVVYNLLNICKQFDIKNVVLNLGGIFERNSELHKELSHYFTNIFFDELPQSYSFAGGLQDFPSHYFSHLYSLALCV